MSKVKVQVGRRPDEELIYLRLNNGIWEWSSGREWDHAGKGEVTWHGPYQTAAAAKRSAGRYHSKPFYTKEEPVGTDFLWKKISADMDEWGFGGPEDSGVACCLFGDWIARQLRLGPVEQMGGGGDSGFDFTFEGVACHLEIGEGHGIGEGRHGGPREKAGWSNPVAKRFVDALEEALKNRARLTNALDRWADDGLIVFTTTAYGHVIRVMSQAEYHDSLEEEAR
jgi:hypothetical protein